MLAPTFTDRNVRLVWAESIRQTQQMLESWLDSRGKVSDCIPDIRADTMTLPFHVINKAGFGVDIPWRSKSSRSRDGSALSEADTIGKGHRMSYREALHSAISHLFHIVIFPTWLLRLVPFKYATFLRIAHEETVAYLKALIVQKEARLRRSHDDGACETSAFDIMNALVSAKIRYQKPGGAEKIQLDLDSIEDEKALTERSILANVFLMLIAGHETTATVLLLTLVELAIDLDWQHQVQKDLDRVFASHAPSTNSFQNDVTRLSNGTVGATINEVLRLYPPANIIPKGTRQGPSQTIQSGPRTFTIPENSAVQLLAVSAHHNSKYWPLDPATTGNNDLDQFRPQRWISNLNSSLHVKSKAGQDDPQEYGHPHSGDPEDSEMSPSLFRPHPGAFIAFSTGHRGCIGRRFAQVELLAVVAVIFRDYSLELDTGEWADEKTVEGMSAQQRRDLYEKAKARTRRVTRDGMRHHLTMQLKKGKLALRLVERGKERFLNADS